MPRPSRFSKGGNQERLQQGVRSNLTSIADANNHTTNFAYNARGWVTQSTFPSTLYETYAYDAVGDLTSKTDRKNQTIQYVYDALNRLSTKTYPDSTSASYVYDLVGKIRSVTDPTGSYGFAYDNMGRLTGTTTQYSFLPGTSSNSYTYDAASNRTSLTAPDGSILEMLVRRAVVDGVVGDVKTKYSQSGLPLDPALAEILFTWKRASEFGGECDWVFASEWKAGELPLRPTSMLETQIKPAAPAADLGSGVGWHAFRHTYSSMLRQLGVDLKVQQELLRHADIRTTMNVYTQAVSEEKRAAHSSVVRMVLA